MDHFQRVRRHDHLRVPLAGQPVQVRHHQPLQRGVQAVFDLVDHDHRAPPPLSGEFAKQQEHLLLAGGQLIQANLGVLAVLLPGDGDPDPALGDGDAAVSSQHRLDAFDEGFEVLAVLRALFQVEIVLPDPQVFQASFPLITRSEAKQPFLGLFWRLNWPASRHCRSTVVRKVQDTAVPTGFTIFHQTNCVK